MSEDPQRLICGHCGLHTHATAKVSEGNIYWLQCSHCRQPIIRASDGTVYPIAPAGAEVSGLPNDVETAWMEARRSFGAGAYTASEVMCRKILMHVAVDKAGADEGKDFVTYVKALDDQGYVPTGMKHVVESIRSRGNVANHELPASTDEDATTTMVVTEHLLRSVYELPEMIPTPTTSPAP